MAKEKVLVIVESPNKKATISSFLPSNYTVEASYGHISNIKDGGSYWNTGINPSKDFEANFAIDLDKKEKVARLKKKADDSDLVIIASDSDREGESIAYSLKKFLKIPNTKYQRITFHEITKTAILEALKNPRKIDEDLVDASHARLKLDKLLGYRLTPAVKKFLNIKSVGRCQTAGLLLINEREQEILNFIPEKYADLYLTFSIDNENFKAKYWGTTEEIKKSSSELCKKIIKDCYKLQDSGKHYSIVDIETKTRVSNSKQPFKTSTFQQEVSSKLGISVKMSMSYAQKLFEGLEINGQHTGLITYMRTDSTDIAEEFIPILEKHIKDTYGKEYYSAITKSKKDDLVQDGHECLRVTDLNMTPEKLSQYIVDKNLLKVYDIIYRRTVASAMASSITAETIYTISIGEYKFKLSSKELRFDGYKKVYAYKDKDSDDTLYKHIFKKGDTLDKYNPDLDLVEKETQPPSRFNESTLVKELESKGIGRPSTYSTIVSVLIDDSRGYCTLENKFIVPTEKGLNLAKLINEKFNELVNINYTKEMEEDLDKIASGKMTEIDFLKAFYDKMESVLDKVIPATQVSSSEVCPICGSSMIVRTGKYGQFLGCSKYPKCKGIKKIGEK